MKRSGLMAVVAATVLVFSLRWDVGAAPPANSAKINKKEIKQNKKRKKSTIQV
jgi:hypothetical protein